MTPIGYDANTLQKRKTSWGLLDLYVCFPGIDARREVDEATYLAVGQLVNLEGV